MERELSRSEEVAMKRIAVFLVPLILLVFGVQNERRATVCGDGLFVRTRLSQGLEIQRVNGYLQICDSEGWGVIFPKSKVNISRLGSRDVRRIRGYDPRAGGLVEVELDDDERLLLTFEGGARSGRPRVILADIDRFGGWAAIRRSPSWVGMDSAYCKEYGFRRLLLFLATLVVSLSFALMRRRARRERQRQKAPLA